MFCHVLVSFPEFFTFPMPPKRKRKPHYSAAPALEFFDPAHELVAPQQPGALVPHQARESFVPQQADVIIHVADHIVHQLTPLVTMCVLCGIVGFLVLLLGWGSTLPTGCF